MLTVYDKSTLSQLNAATAVPCGVTLWYYGVTQVVTNTSGCPSIDVVAASFETDVVRVDERHQWPLLYLGRTAIVSCRFTYIPLILMPNVAIFVQL